MFLTSVCSLRIGSIPVAHLGVGLLLPCQVGDLIPNPLTMNEQLKSKSRMPMLMECMSGKQQRPIFNIKHMLIDLIDTRRGKSDEDSSRNQR